MTITVEQAYRKKWMTDDQWECALFIADLFRGFHHVTGTFKRCHTGIEINSRNAANHFATYDFDGLTRAVVMAHDRCIRFSVEPSGPGLLRLRAHKRHKREGRMSERHPTIEQAIAEIRK